MDYQSSSGLPVSSPWRDGTAAGAISADLFDEVVKRLLHDAPESTQHIEDLGALNYIESIVSDASRMQEQHFNYLVLALGDNSAMNLASRFSARVRLVAENARRPVAV